MFIKATKRNDIKDFFTKEELNKHFDYRDSRIREVVEDMIQNQRYSVEQCREIMDKGHGYAIKFASWLEMNGIIAKRYSSDWTVLVDSMKQIGGDLQKSFGGEISRARKVAKNAIRNQSYSVYKCQQITKRGHGYATWMTNLFEECGLIRHNPLDWIVLVHSMEEFDDKFKN